MKLKYVTLALIILLSYFISCNTIEPNIPIRNSKIDVELIDVSCDEAWINIKTEKIELPVWLFYRVNGGGNNSLLLYSPDTSIYHTGYIPQFENSFILSNSINFHPDSTKELIFNTLDTTLENYTWILDTLGSTQSDVTGIWGSNSNDVWVTGTFTSNTLTSLLAHYDGIEWKYVRPNDIHKIGGIQSGDLFGIKGIDENNIWVVGNGEGAAYPSGDSVWAFAAYYDGNEWKDISPNLPNERLFNAWALSRDKVWAVGTNGTIIFYDGNNWTKQFSGTNLQLGGIDGIDENNIYVVGYSFDYTEGVALHFDGKTWEKIYLNGNNTEPLRSVKVFSKRKIWIVGTSTYVYNGERWNLLGVIGSDQTTIDGSGYNDIFIGGFQSQITHFDGLNLNKIEINGMGLENAGIYGVIAFQDKIYFAGRGGIGFDKRGFVYTATK